MVGRLAFTSWWAKPQLSTQSGLPTNALLMIHEATRLAWGLLIYVALRGEACRVDVKGLLEEYWSSPQ